MTRHLFVVDPLGPIDIRKDSSFALMWAAQARGHELYTCDTDGLSAVGREGFARCRPTTVRKVQGDHHAMGPAQQLPLSAFDVVWMRKDPPFDMQYIASTYVLDLAPTTTRVWSRPAALRSWNEKTSLLQFGDLAPKTLLSRDKDQILAFAAQVGGSVVLKPLGYSGGNGIVALHPGDLNARSLVEILTRQGKEFIVAQQYLPAVRDGDKRVILVHGVARAGLLRIPPADDLRGNIHIGATTRLSPLTPAEQHICDTIGPVLRAAGHLFVGIDLIGERLTEINVTSPTGIHEIRDQGGPDLAEELVDAALETP
ncbi:MAG: glutathione synthase [Deltaproteobacteria bacterium]|nr:glutathione synthase [Deltaproteobacteria bacterium]